MVALANSTEATTRVTPQTHTPVIWVYVSGLRYYIPELGQWVNRDPIGERGGESLYGFNRNRPVDLTDPHGLAPWHACCAGKKYNVLTHCCCDSGKVVWYGSAACDLIKRKEIDTGVKTCRDQIPWHAWADHEWIEIEEWSAGFRPGGVSYPKDIYSDRPTKKCRSVELDPCRYDIKKFKDAIKDIAAEPTRKYHKLLNNCLTWRVATLLKARNRSRGGCGNP